MTIKGVVKRNGEIVPYDRTKIEAAIDKAITAVEGKSDFSRACELASKAEAKLRMLLYGVREHSIPAIEEIQDIVEDVLIDSKEKAVAKAYILYRSKRSAVRDTKALMLDINSTMDGYLGQSDWRVHENANVNYSLGGLILHNSGAMTANYWLNNIYGKEIAEAHKSCAFHLHDLSMFSGYCAGWSLRQLISEGLGGVEGKITSTPPSHLSTLVNQMVNFLGILQNEWAGAQAFSSFDTYCASFVKAGSLTEKETKQCIQSFLYGVNTPSRWGCVDTSTVIKGKDKYLSYNEIKEGDLIWTLNVATMERELLPVKKVIRKKAMYMIGIVGELVTRSKQNAPIRRKSGKEEYDYLQVVTEEHRCLVFNADGNLVFRLAKDICKGDILPTADDKKVIVTSIEKYIYGGEVWCVNTDNNTAFYSRCGYVFVSSNSQAPFTNITLDWTCPQDLKDKKAIVGGKEMDFTYGDCQKEMDTVNRVFIELMLEGDANKRGFAYPIPTYNMTKNFDWESDNSKLLFEMASQYGTPYFQNFINSDLNPSDVLSMCCRLRLDKRELRKRGGGLFGSDEFTGSIGVVTINMPQIGYLHKGDKVAFYNRLDYLMDLARDSLITKRKVLSHLLESGLYPYTARYLKNFNNHFNTIGLCGMNECCLNFMDVTITSQKGHDFAVEVLEHMRARLQDYQEATGELFNLEATPAEGTSYRLALHDKQNYPDIITSGTRDPFYTNSTQLPVNGTSDVFDALDAQESLQTLYTGGTVFHVFMGERIKDWKACRDLVKAIMTNYRVPYITISPTYSICPVHGYLEGEHFECPKCKAERITQLQKRLAELEAEKERLIGGRV